MIRDYYLQKFKEKKIFNEDEIVSDLSPQLKAEVSKNKLKIKRQTIDEVEPIRSRDRAAVGPIVEGDRQRLI